MPRERPLSPSMIDGAPEYLGTQSTSAMDVKIDTTSRRNRTLRERSTDVPRGPFPVIDLSSDTDEDEKIPTRRIVEEEEPEEIMMIDSPPSSVVPHTPNG